MINHVLRFNFSSIRYAPLLVVGSGTAGINFSSQMIADNHAQPNQITIMSGSNIHGYQPGWTMVGGGLVNVSCTMRTTTDIIPKGVQYINQDCVRVDADNNTVYSQDGTQWIYQQLVLVPGIKLDWKQIAGINCQRYKFIYKGAQAALQDPLCPVASIYDSYYAVKMNSLVGKLKGGRAIFTEPNMPIKCAGAPQKILYLSHDRWRKANIKVQVEFHKTIGVMFGVPKYSKILEGLAKEKGIEVHLKSKLVEVRGQDRVAIFQNQDTKELQSLSFDLLHVVPPQIPPSFISESGLGDASGFVNVVKETMQSLKYKNVWAMGDASNLPTSKTAAAIMAQTPILVKNLVQQWKQNLVPTHIYGGYTSCPIFTSQNKLLLAEFKYDGVLDETFGGWLQNHPNRIMFHLKKDFFPFAYWKLMCKGLWAGREGFRFFKN